MCVYVYIFKAYYVVPLYKCMLNNICIKLYVVPVSEVSLMALNLVPCRIRYQSKLKDTKVLW